MYNRQAVTFKGDQYESRPEPDNPTDDQPHPGGRGKFSRSDGGQYQIDATGHSHNIPDKIAAKPVSLADYLADQENQTGYYAERTGAEKLNWCEPMSRMELDQAGLKANRQSIPGDWDYTEVNQ